LVHAWGGTELLIDGLLIKRCQEIDSRSAFLSADCINIQPGLWKHLIGGNQ
jgi:hypothetical protein